VTRPRLVLTVAAFALDGALGLALMHVLEEVGWPTLAALLRHYGLAS
jgi:hypothetical protein